MGSGKLGENAENRPRDRDPEQLRIYAEYRGRLEQEYYSISAQFDKAILTLSSGILALSVAFINQLIPVSEASTVWLLFIGWIAFLGAIVTTLFGLVTSQKAYEKQIEYTDKYYLENRDEYLTKENRHGNRAVFLNKVSSTFFFFGVLLLVLFVGINFSKV